MAEFTPITINSQEELNRLFGERAAQAKRSAEAEAAQKYAGYDDYKAKAEKYDTDIGAKDQRIAELEGEKTTSAARITELEGKVREYETSSVKMRIARETGLPVELADRLAGEDEASMRKDAESLAKLIKGQNVAPLKQTDNGAGGGGGDEAALKKLLNDVRNN